MRPDREHKSVGSETTFATDLFEWDELTDGLDGSITNLWQDCQRLKTTGRMDFLHLTGDRF
ncbi:hypothetical protein [Fibrella forsythiae]|uniref:hypothetical protein n=1 Tax=Fibrella forsythiae TaxID=2817061 RepID=UPI00286D88E7|nr:hypothetical protein [Fibrella forsythiae]